MNVEQMKINERWLINMMSLTKSWIWKDEMEFYKFEDNKILPSSKEGYVKLSKIVRPDFVKIFVKEVL